MKSIGVEHLKKILMESFCLKIRVFAEKTERKELASNRQNSLSGERSYNSDPSLGL